MRKDNLARKVSAVFAAAAAAAACAAEESVVVDSDGIYKYYGDVNIHGNPTSSPSSNIYDEVDILLNGTAPGRYDNTTEALTISGGKVFTVNKTFSVVNATQNPIIDNNGAVYASAGSEIDLTGLESIYIASVGGSQEVNDSTAISAKTTGFLKSQNNRVQISAETVQIIGSVDVGKGVILGSGANTVDLELKGAGSFWYGSAVSESSVNRVNLSLADDAVWIFTAEGSDDGDELKSIDLNGGVVEMNDGRIADIYKNTIIKGTQLILADYRDLNAKHSALEIGELKGEGGVFSMDLDWESNQGVRTHTASSDFVKIGKGIGASNNLVVFDHDKANLASMQEGDKLYFASVGEGDVKFRTDADGRLDASNELYFFNIETKSEEAEGSTYWYLTKTRGEENSNALMVRSAGLASYAAATHLDGLKDRRSSALSRSADGRDVWVRFEHSKDKFSDSSTLTRNLVQAGFDVDVSTSGAEKTIGMFFDYSKGDSDVSGLIGSGDVERYAFNLAYTVEASCGGYADFVARIGRIGSDYDVYNSESRAIGASYWQTFYGISAEAGRRFDLSGGFYAEPRVQLQATRIEGDEFTTKSGISAEIGDVNSIIGRIGARAGFDAAAASLYIEADAVREFHAENDFSARGAATWLKDSESRRGSWYDVGAGVSTSSMNGLKLKAASKYVFGGDYSGSFRAEIEARYEF